MNIEDVFIIEDISSSNFGNYLLEKESDSDIEFYANPKALKLVEDKINFEIGDKVLITNKAKELLVEDSAWNSQMDRTLGKVGVVEETGLFSDRIQVRFEEDDDCWYYIPAGLQLVKDESFPRKMLVWDMDGETPIERTVIAYCEGRTEPWITANDWDDIDDSDFEGYTYAKEIEEEEVISKEQKLELNTIVKVISGGSGALCADGAIARVCTKEEALADRGMYGGELSGEQAGLYVINSNHSYGLCPGYEVEVL